jgi:alkylation response protein AidB-like acyl-CoA dehydrogenase
VDLLPGPVEDAAVACLHAVLDRPSEAVLAAGGLDAPTVTAEAQVAVALGRTLAPAELTFALLAVPHARTMVAVPRPGGGHACFGPPDAGIVLLWDDDGLAIADGFVVDEVVECLDPASQMALGEVTSPGPPSREAATRATLLVAAVCAGLARGAQDMAVEYARAREQFGRPIGANQAIKHLCADAATRSEAAWASVNYASISLTEGRTDAEFRVAVAARVAQHGALENGRTNIQVHGGRGYTLDCPAHGFLLRARVLEQLAGGARRARRALLAHDPLA